MDLSLTTAPDSTQVNAEDFLVGSKVVTITGVRAGAPEQPVNIDLAEYPDRAYRPGKSMRRVLVAAWGADSSAYIGRRLELFCDPDISFGRERVGGIRIAAMSDLKGNKPLTVALTVSRGSRKPFVVQPLAEIPDYLEQARAATDVDEVKAIWQRAKSAGHMTDALNAALKPIGEALKTPPAAETAPIPGTEND